MAYDDSVDYYDWNHPAKNDWRNQMAVETFKKAISLNPGNFDLQYHFTDRICYNLRGPGDDKYQSGTAAYQDNWIECVQQIKKTVALRPGDSDLHYHFARVVCGHAQWDFRYEDNQDDAWIAAWVECSQQIKQALDIDPRNEDALRLARDYAQWAGPYWKGRVIEMGWWDAKLDWWAQPDFILLTPTATLAPTIPVTVTPTSTPTSIPTLTLIPSPSVQPSPTPSLTAVPPTNTPTPLPPAAETGINAAWAWILVSLAGIAAWVVLRKRNGS